MSETPPRPVLDRETVIAVVSAMMQMGWLIGCPGRPRQRGNEELPPVIPEGTLCTNPEDVWYTFAFSGQLGQFIRAWAMSPQAKPDTPVEDQA